MFDYKFHFHFLKRLQQLQQRSQKVCMCTMYVENSIKIHSIHFSARARVCVCLQDYLMLQWVKQSRGKCDSLPFTLYRLRSVIMVIVRWFFLTYGWVFCFIFIVVSIQSNQKTIPLLSFFPLAVIYLWMYTRFFNICNTF